MWSRPIDIGDEYLNYQIVSLKLRKMISGIFKCWDMKIYIYFFPLKLFTFSCLKLIFLVSTDCRLEIWIDFIQVLVISYAVRLSKVVFCGISYIYSTLWKKTWRNDTSAGFFFFYFYLQGIYPHLRASLVLVLCTGVFLGLCRPSWTHCLLTSTKASIIPIK